MTLICLFGPDGSGKTSLAKNLVKELKSQGIEVRTSWMRGSHVLASILARFLVNFLIFRGFDNPYYHFSIPENMKRLWQIIEFISILPIVITRFILPSLKRTIVAERYLPDFLVWVTLTTNDMSYLKSFEAKFILRLLSKKYLKIYVKASLDELFKRRGNEVSRKFLYDQVKLYNLIAKIINAYEIDTTNKTIEESLEELRNLLKLQ